MPTRIKRAQERRIIAKLVMDLYRTASPTMLHEEHFGSSADEVLLCAAIFVGQSEARPMTAAKLADYSGIPRPTVHRKLRKLQERGVVDLVDGKATLARSMLNAPPVLEHITHATRRIREAAAELSKMDTKTVARRPPDS